MKNCALFIITFACALVFALGAHAATVLIDPATQECPPVGESITVGVNMQDVTGLFGCSFELNFDNTALKFSAMEQGDFLGSDGASTITFLNNQVANVQGLTPEELALINFQGVTPELTDEVNLAGKMTVATSRLGSSLSVNGSGEIVSVTFEVLEVKPSTIALQEAHYSDPDQALTGEEIAADIQNGAVEVPVVIEGDVSGNGEVTAWDATLTLQILIGSIPPTEYQKQMLDVNGDGNIGDDEAIPMAILILQKVVGLAAPGVGVVASTDRRITVALADAHGVAGESITVPVEVDNAFELAGGSISVQYDQTVLRAVEVASDPDGMLASNLSKPGTVRIAFVGTDKRSRRTVAKIKFDILTDNASPLKFQSVKLYSHGARPLISRNIDRKFSSWAMAPKHNKLLQNFPNPFNPETWIPYQLKDASEVTIRIYNTAGQLVRVLDVGHQSAGLYVSRDRAAYWDGRNKFGMEAASGIYFYSIRAGDFSAVRKFIVLR